MVNCKKKDQQTIHKTHLLPQCNEKQKSELYSTFSSRYILKSTTKNHFNLKIQLPNKNFINLFTLEVSYHHQSSFWQVYSSPRIATRHALLSWTIIIEQRKWRFGYWSPHALLVSELWYLPTRASARTSVSQSGLCSLLPCYPCYQIHHTCRATAHTNFGCRHKIIAP